jgi:hypothetical protein
MLQELPNGFVWTLLPLSDTHRKTWIENCLFTHKNFGLIKFPSCSDTSAKKTICLENSKTWAAKNKKEILI